MMLVGCGGGGGGGESTPVPTPPPPPPLPAGTLALSASTYSVAQSTGLLTVTVNRMSGSRDGTVTYATANGTGHAGADYTARNGTLVWTSGDADPKTISLPIANTVPNTIDKTFTITLSNPTNGIALGATTTATVTITATTPSLTHAVSVRGNRLIDAAGNILQLRGVSFSGFEFVAIGGWSPSDPSGGQAGQPNGPRWTAVKAWNANTVRFTLNETSWLGLTCVDADGVTRDGDPGDNYRSAIATQVQQANAAGLYVILELHWAAPGNTCPMVQTQMANADHSIDFWTSVATTFKDNSAVLFALYNEPFFFGLKYDDDVAVTIDHCVPHLPPTVDTNIHTGTTPDEVALRMQVPVALPLAGAYVFTQPIGDFALVLYSETNAVLATTTWYAINGVQGGVDREQVLEFPTPFLLVPNTTYRLAMKPLSASNVSMRYYPLAPGWEGGAPYGPQCYYSHRTDGGAWTDFTGRVPPIAPFYDGDSLSYIPPPVEPSFDPPLGKSLIGLCWVEFAAQLPTPE